MFTTARRDLLRSVYGMELSQDRRLRRRWTVLHAIYIGLHRMTISKQYTRSFMIIGILCTARQGVVKRKMSIDNYKQQLFCSIDQLRSSYK